MRAHTLAIPNKHHCFPLPPALERSLEKLQTLVERGTLEENTRWQLAWEVPHFLCKFSEYCPERDGSFEHLIAGLLSAMGQRRTAERVRSEADRLQRTYSCAHPRGRSREGVVDYKALFRSEQGQREDDWAESISSLQEDDLSTSSPTPHSLSGRQCEALDPGIR
jgi:hypothetical protein